MEQAMTHNHIHIAQGTTVTSVFWLPNKHRFVTAVQDLGTDNPSSRLTVGRLWGGTTRLQHAQNF